jgi:phage-related protein
MVPIEDKPQLRVKDGPNAWRIIYRLDADAVVILDVFKKTTRKTPRSVIHTCRQRLRRYDASCAEE